MCVVLKFYLRITRWCCSAIFDICCCFLLSDITALVKKKAYARINLDEFSIHEVISRFLYNYGVVSVTYPEILVYYGIKKWEEYYADR